MTEIDKINDKVFKNTFENVENVRAFLKIALPEPLKKVIDFSEIVIDPTNYVSNKFKEGFTDIVAKTEMKTGDKDGSEIETDIYILFEHKCFRDEAIFIQLLWYMYLMWQKDIDERKPLRVIIPMVFYHGKEKWKVPQSFVEQFNVNEEVKEFLLDYRYVLFDTANWDFKDEANEELRDNVFLLSALALMKNVYNEEFEPILEIFKFWYEQGFIRERDKVLFFLTYISETRDINPDKLKKILEESKIEGGDIMPTLAERLRDEGRREGITEGIKEGIKEGMREGMKEGMKEEKLGAARRMLIDNVPIETIVKYTGLKEDEIKALMH